MDTSSGGYIIDSSTGNITIPKDSVVSGQQVSGVTQNVTGSATDTTVMGGPSLSASGPINNAYYPPGIQTIQSGGTVTNTTIIADGINGYTYGQFFSALASQTIENGGRAINTTLQGNLKNPLIGTGIAANYTVSNFLASQIVSSGGQASGTNITPDGQSTILSGGYATNTTLQGAQSNVQLGNFISQNATVPSLAQQIVYGTSENINILSNGYVKNFGNINNVTVSSDGVLEVASGGTASNITVASGGTLDIDQGAVFNTPITIQSGGNIIFSDINNSNGLISSYITPLSAGAQKGELQVLSSGVTLKNIPVQGDISTPLSNRAINYSNKSYDQYGNVIYDQAASSDLRPFPTGALETSLGTPYLFSAFGTPCFCPGTLIATEEGETPIEELTIGDLVRTASGELRPIHWIGRRSYDPLFAHGNRDVMPILIRADALAPGLPQKDLTISPLHAMFIDGFLIPALHLVNDQSIIQITPSTEITYIHLELESHDLLIANGAPSESFIDDRSRNMFHNAHEYQTLYPEAQSQHAHYCAPRLEEGAELAKIQTRINQRAKHLFSTEKLTA
ncbi:Hint domain-containing protein [Swingsia samuiensis]|uniref:Hedgehog/Intein (Hint) domain-containing protein n=1 Tax=Swingsia samuiensis TaxID=1293412 RepID=A0A4Y6UKB8_9PROT|nr:Hint domain-containing protein [Swingsia samuiensis]QDH16831.1 hypothetical protein E3D00_04060 [Swingsia samuiensis]